jgi:hypothetical protein
MVTVQNSELISDMTYTICIYIILHRIKIKQCVGLDVCAKGTSAYDFYSELLVFYLSVAQHSDMVYCGIMSKIRHL